MQCQINSVGMGEFPLSTGVTPNIKIHKIPGLGAVYLVGPNIWYNYVLLSKDGRHQQSITNIPKLKEHSNERNTSISNTNRMGN